VIINIHGLDSGGANSKYEWLRQNAAGHEIWSPDIDYRNTAPTEILNFLKIRIPEKKEDVYAVGSSMGGFFARIINQTYPDVTAILINPSLAPFIGLRGVGKIDCKGYIELAAKYAYSDDAAWRNLYVIAGDADELIDHRRVTARMLPPGFDAIYWIKGGTHRMSVFSPEVDTVLRKILRPEK
jgi:predicted esterase YcpF (UPF0227 family)